MKILRARLTGFRNLADGEIEFSPGVNLVLGSNGQGKTNLLEALNFPALGRSHRGARTEELIRFGEQHLHVHLELADDDGNQRTCEFGLDRDGTRRFRIDGRQIARRIELVGQLATVFFWPQSVDLVRGGPDQRRRFADQGLSGLDPAYLAALSAYQRALRQKSSLLRDLRRGFRRAVDARDELAAWNRELAAHAVPIGLGRAEWAGLIAPFAAGVYADLAGRPAPLEFAYRPRLEALAAPAEKADLTAGILAEFDYIGADETRRGRPLTGVQFDDFEVRLGDLDLRVFGSQGETRTAAISLILAQSDVVHARRRVRPVLFLDDIFSELDRDRARQLQQRCAKNHQIFIATARADDVAGWQPDEIRQWRVEDGRLTALS
jgi:DNA replication and repair protein RecF